ncbi:MAG: hypothetical protein IK060_01475 [Methanomicrobium sp.]|nr:hypothetical protein [Methanomicrobium sp.]MBR6011005.1 hypothetical protein [Methanomicrobium sp.]MBR6447182.1 hypothetical protein [Methanomicrobium sp.]MBR6497044.1 hypothetical protein [Methanomicrobium sp.]
MDNLHKELILLFISVIAGFIAGRIAGTFPLSLLAAVATTLIVYYAVDFVIKKFVKIESKDEE